MWTLNFCRGKDILFTYSHSNFYKFTMTFHSSLNLKLWNCITYTNITSWQLHVCQFILNLYSSGEQPVLYIFDPDPDPDWLLHVRSFSFTSKFLYQLINFAMNSEEWTQITWIIEIYVKDREIIKYELILGYAYLQFSWSAEQSF